MKTPTLLLTPIALTSILLGTNIAQAQTYTPSNRIPVADNTSIGTQVSGSNNNFSITGGLNRGQNLFHSFTDFSVPTGGSATFINPVGDRSIITRVTGNLFSDINGLVNTQGANFFLINPNGMVFGPNAQLNVGKAFVGSTANGIDLVDGSGRTVTFGTNANGDAPLLSVNPSVFFNVSRLNIGEGTGAISNFGTLQTSNPNQYIGLIGGNISMNGGQINAPGGRVEIGGLSTFGNVALGVDGNNLRAQFSQNVARGDVSLTNGVRVNVAGAGGGDIAINARNLEILNGSVVRGGIETELGTPEAVAGDIKLNATGEITIGGSNTGIANNVRSDSKGKGGKISIAAGSLSLRDGAQLAASTFGTGNAGNVTVTAKDAVSLGNSDILSTVGAGGVGKGGTIEINAGSLSMTNGAQLLTITRRASDTQPAGQGDAGDVTVNVSGAVDIAGNNGTFFSKIGSAVETGTKGHGGKISIAAGSLSLRDGAQLAASTFGTGNAGNVTVTAKDAVSLGNGDILSTVGAGGVGKGGTIEINAGSLSMTNGAQLLTITRRASDTQPAGQGDAGDVTVNVSGAVDIAGNNGTFFSKIGSAVETGTKGHGGKISIAAGSLSLRDGAQLAASTFGTGNAGNVTVTAKDAVSLGNGDILSAVEAGGVGNGGTIEINAGSLSMTNGAQLEASTFGTGNAGNVTVTAKDAVSLGNGDILSTVGAGGVGKGGTIEINAGSLSMTNGAQLVTITRRASDTQPAGQGDAGDVTVNVSGAVDIAGINGTFSSGIFSLVETGTKGHGGKISIAAGSLSLHDGAQLAASTFGTGNAGNVTVTAKDAVSLGNGDILSTVGAGGVGKGGTIEINAGSLSMTNGAQLLTITRRASDTQPAGQGDAGDVTVNVSGAVDIAGNNGTFFSKIGSAVETGTKGHGGKISIAAGSLSLRDGAQLAASTFGTGNAGTIKVNATDFLTISDKNGNFNTGLFVESYSLNGTAGDIIVTSPKITLDNSVILARSLSGNGGNINIGGNIKGGSAFSPGTKIDISNLTPVDLLLLRNGAIISTEAFGTAQQGGNGGNININSDLIVAIPKENSDISANAVKGRGGNVNINSQGLFGIQFRPRLTENSDITASSDFGLSGNVNISTPGTDPGRDKGELAEAPNDASNQISQACGASQRDNKFYITGRGGLPPNAREPQESDALWEDPRAATQLVVSNVSSQTTRKLAPPAVGWVFDGKGKVMLIAAETEGAPTGTRVVCSNEGK